MKKHLPVQQNEILSQRETKSPLFQFVSSLQDRRARHRLNRASGFIMETKNATVPFF